MINPMLFGHESTNFEEELLEFMYSHGSHTHANGEKHSYDREILIKGIGEDLEKVKEIILNEKNDFPVSRILSFFAKPDIDEAKRNEVQRFVLAEKKATEFSSTFRDILSDPNNLSNQEVVEMLSMDGKSFSDLGRKEWSFCHLISSVSQFLIENDLKGETASELKLFLDEIDQEGLSSDVLNIVSNANSRASILVERQAIHKSSQENPRKERVEDLSSKPTESKAFPNSGNRLENKPHSLTWLCWVLGALILGGVGVLVWNNRKGSSAP